IAVVSAPVRGESVTGPSCGVKGDKLFESINVSLQPALTETFDRIVNGVVTGIPFISVVGSALTTTVEVPE
ncbi:hypothetical protein PMAYCL1PPCAC_10631, partial [Pristionchus mayeri]